jgi:hypothetical protein
MMLLVAAGGCGSHLGAATDASVKGDALGGDALGDSQPVDSGPLPAYCATNPWMGLEACGWPGPMNTGPDLSQCPGGVLTNKGSSSNPGAVFNITADGTAIRCQKVYGSLHLSAKNVTIENSYVEYTSGKTGTDANGTAPILVDDGADATISHVEINGLDGVHACIWHQGTSLAAHYVNCYGVDDGIFSWADTSFSPTTGDAFTIDHSYFHDFTTTTSNGHEDGYQTEGASDGVIRHNTYNLTTDADSAVAIWDSLKSSSNIVVEDNLITGGGFSMYAEDYSPSDTAPSGGFTVSGIKFMNNKFSTHAAGCVGAFGVWFFRQAWTPYQGGPTDGWHRSGNVVIETGENVDHGNPHSGGGVCN